MLLTFKIKNKLKKMQYNIQKEEAKLCNQYKKYSKKYLNKRVNFIVRDYDENENEIIYKLKGEVIGFNNFGARDDSAGYLCAVIMPDNFDDSINLDYDLFNEIDLKDIKSLSIKKNKNIMNNRLVIRVTKEEQTAYQNLAKEQNKPISKIIRDYLNKLTTK
jgi:hypothetical protein